MFVCMRVCACAYLYFGHLILRLAIYFSFPPSLLSCKIRYVRQLKTDKRQVPLPTAPIEIVTEGDIGLSHHVSYEPIYQTALARI